jgi:predicted phage-related endonuclease
MIIIKQQQGSDEWKANRQNQRNASEASMIMGVHSNVKRDQLLHMKATATEQEFSDFVQKFVLDRGHEIEALARPIIEKRIGDELFPRAGKTDDEYLYSSFDGLNFARTIVWECKQWNKQKAVDVSNQIVPECDYWQVVQEMEVSGAELAVYTVTDGTEENTISVEIKRPDADIKKLYAAWKQFDQDLEIYKTKLANGEIKQTVQAQAEVLLDLPAITFNIDKDMALTSNFDKFKEQARELIKKSREPLVTDDDFATAESLVKVFKSAEEKLSGLSEQVISEVSDIDAFIKELKQVSEGMRQARLATEKLVTAEKQNRRQEIINKAQHDLNNHIQAQQTKLDGYALPAYNADFAGAMRGKKTIESLQSAANDCLANAKIVISQQADEGAANLKAFNELAVDHKFLFADLQQNLFKPADDFTAMVKSRISDHKEAEEKRLEAERERIRQEEAAKAAKQPEPEPEELPLAAEKPALKQQVNAVMDNKKSGGELSGIVNADLLDAEINSIVRYMTEEGYPLKHLKAIASIVYAFNESEESEKEIFAFADSIKKKYGVAA